MYVTTKAGQTLATKQALETAGRKLFAARGYAGVSAEDIVAAAGVTRGALYHHYDGKQGLFEAVVDSCMRELHLRLAQAAQRAPDPLQGLQAGIRAFLKHSTDGAIQRILLIDAPAALGWQKWREMDARYGLGLLRQGLAAAMQAGQIRKQPDRLLAQMLLAALIEAALLVSRAEHPARAQREAERTVMQLIDGLRVVPVRQRK
jgi:AcrR family transcriptional regulator